MKVYVIFFFMLALMPLTNALTAYEDCSIYGSCKPVSTSSSTTNINNTFNNITIINGTSYNSTYDGLIPYVYNYSLSDLPYCNNNILGNKTTITSQNKGFVYINNSGSAVSNNKTYRIDDTTALPSINLNATTFQIGGQTVQIQPFIGTSSGGCSYTYASSTGTMRCSGGRFQDEIQVGYYVSITTCGDNRIKARVSTITNQTELVLANNNLGNGCGNSFSDANGKPLVNPSVQVKGSDGTLIGQFVEYYDATPALHQEFEYAKDFSLEAGKSVKFKTNGYINFGTDDSAGQGYIQHASTTHIKLTNADETEFYRTITFLSDASGGATKYQTIRGSDNGGTTNGAGTEWLQYAGKSRGTGVAGFRWYASSPIASGTGLQSWNQVLYLIHNKLQSNVTLNMTGFEGQFNDIVGIKKLEFGGSNATISSDGGNVIINVSGGYTVQARNQSGGYASFEGNGYITHTDVFDKNKTNRTALSYVKKANELLTIDGKVNHSAFEYSYVKTPIVEVVGYTKNTWKEKNCDYENSTGVWLEFNCTFSDKTYLTPITNITGYTDGIDLVLENSLLTAKIEELSTELCRVEKTKYNFCNIDGSLKK